MEIDSQTTTSTVSNKANADLEMLCGLPIKSITTEDKDEVLEVTLRMLAEHIGANHGYILIKNSNLEPEEQLNLIASYSRPQDSSNNTFSNPLVNKTLQTDESQFIQNAMKNQEFTGDPSFQTFNIKCALCVPIKTMWSPLGVMYFDNTEEECKWNEHDLKLLEVVARYIGLAIKAVQLQEEKHKNSRLIAAGQASLHISHSVKNILQLIGGAVEVIDFGLRTNQMHRVIRSWDILKPNLERIKKFTLDLLDFSKERQLEFGPCQFNRIVQDAINSLRAQLKQKNTKLNIRVDPKMPIVNLDGERVHVVAVNLILNALDVVDEKTGIVNVQTEYNSVDGLVALIVSDNGPGIDKKARENIFLPYESTKSKNRLKTGLGLAIAKQIVELHKGRIDVESSPGKGTTFKVFLPCRAIKEDG